MKLVQTREYLTTKICGGLLFQGLESPCMAYGLATVCYSNNYGRVTYVDKYCHNMEVNGFRLLVVGSLIIRR